MLGVRYKFVNFGAETVLDAARSLVPIAPPS